MQNLPWKKTSEVAKIIRSILKANFPETAFSVRSKSYANGSSITIRWIDGPTNKNVDNLVKHLQSVSHVDNTDLIHCVPYSEHDGEKFNSMANYIFTSREFSVDFIRPLAEDAAIKYGYEGKYEIIEDKNTIRQIVTDYSWHSGRFTFDDLIYKIARSTNGGEVLDQVNKTSEERWPPISLV